MGNYNPRSPYFLGEEMVTIRDYNLEPNPLLASAEYGSSFSLDAATTINHARFYVNGIPSTTPNSFYTIAVYPRGQEAEWGPIRSCIIPVDAVTVSGGWSTNGGPSGGAAAMLSPLPDYSYSADFNDVSAVMWISYNVNQYAQLLNGKRILGVNVLLGAGQDTGDPNPPLCGVTDQTTVGNTLSNLGVDLIIPDRGFDSEISRTRLGQTALFNATTLATAEYLPWTYNDLAKFDASAASRVYFAIGFGSLFGNTLSCDVWYSALEVIYCDETRVALGCVLNGVGSGDNTQTGPNWGANVARMRSWQSKSLNPSLPAGDYVVTMSTMETHTNEAFDTPMSFNAIQLAESLYTHDAVEIDIPYPPEDNLEAQVESVYTTVIPQISLHASGAPIVLTGTNLTQPQIYGRVGAAQVFGATTAAQVITDVVTSATYPWVRFYARHMEGTTSPLSITGPASVGSSVAAISVDEFDELEEIADGWKEITLRFATAPTMGSLTPTWTFSAAQETQNTRWEILSAVAPATSGLPGDLFGQAPNQLSNGTYNPNVGAGTNLVWMPQGVSNVYVSGASADQTADAVLYFGQDSPTVTGLSISVASQAVSGIGIDCVDDPCGIPTDIQYMQLGWNNAANGYRITRDDFATAGATWGLVSTGEDWSGDGAAFTRSGGYGIINSANGVTNSATLTIGSGSADQDVRYIYKIGSLPDTSLVTTLSARYTNSTNQIYLQSTVSTSNGLGWVSCELYVAATSGGAILVNQLKGKVLDLTHEYGMRLQVSGPRVQAKFWDATVEDEPDDWQVDFNQSRLTTGNLVAVGTLATTVSAVNVSFRDFKALVGSPVKQFGYYELQRSDDITDWQTIMAATDPFVTGFKDYEARVGMESDYRIRIVDAHGFYGAWSSTVSATLASPGVSGSCLDGAHILILTSNEMQDGSSNLAYSAIWEGTVEEGFNFLEGGQVTYQQMYGRDYQVAFHQDERGGTTFTRDVLVQAAAISPPTLEDFTSLRDMAWQDLSYICVRDEDGNRWFTNVRVPNAKVQLYRKLYFANLVFTQVTDTPTQVNP